MFGFLDSFPLHFVLFFGQLPPRLPLTLACWSIHSSVEPYSGSLQQFSLASNIFVLNFCIFGHKFCILHCYVICMFVCCTSFHSPFAGHPLWPFESILLHHGQAPQPEAEAQKQNKTMHWRKTNKQNQTPTG